MPKPATAAMAPATRAAAKTSGTNASASAPRRPASEAQRGPGPVNGDERDAHQSVRADGVAQDVAREVGPRRAGRVLHEEDDIATSCRGRRWSFFASTLAATRASLGRPGEGSIARRARAHRSDQERIDVVVMAVPGPPPQRLYGAVVRTSAIVGILACAGLVFVAAGSQIDRPAQDAVGAADQLASRAEPAGRGGARDDAPLLLKQTAATIDHPVGPELPAAPGETRDVEVMVRNDGNAVWEANGANAVKLSYHLYDVSGKLLAWDGLRTTLPHDITPGYAGALALRVALPAATGTYSVKPDLIRDGQAWFSATGAQTSAFPLRVTTALDAGYGATTTPASIVPG